MKIKHLITGTRGEDGLPAMEYECTDGKRFNNINFARFHQAGIDKSQHNALCTKVAAELAGKGVLLEAELYDALTDQYKVRFGRALNLWLVHTKLKPADLQTDLEKQLITATERVLETGRNAMYWQLPPMHDLSAWLNCLKNLARQSLADYSNTSSSLNDPAVLLGDLVIAAIQHALKTVEQPINNTVELATA